FIVPGIGAVMRLCTSSRGGKSCAFELTSRSRNRQAAERLLPLRRVVYRQARQALLPGPVPPTGAGARWTAWGEVLGAWVPCSCRVVRTHRSHPVPPAVRSPPSGRAHVPAARERS